MEYQRLGDYIREVNVRNSELKVTNLLGLSMTKQFRPSTSNIVGVDLSKYKVVATNTFAFDPMSVIRVHKVPIAINDTESPIIVSPAYYTFEIINTMQLLPKYLMMWFQRTEFDRYADFKSDAAVRGGYDWNELCDTPIDIPSIARQREIMEEYETLSRRIRLNEQMIAKLEETAQALYRKMFVDGIDKENLPEGWRRGTLGEVAEIKGGKRLPKGVELQSDKNGHPYIKVADMSVPKYVMLNSSFQYVDDEAQKQIKQYIVNTNDVIVSIVGTIGNVNVIDQSLDNANLTENCVKLINLKGVSCHFLYSFLTSKDGQLLITQSVVGGVQAKLPIYNIERIELLIPSTQALRHFDSKIEIVDKEVKLRQQENEKLTELQSLLLARMGK